MGEQVAQRSARLTFPHETHIVDAIFNKPDDERFCLQVAASQEALGALFGKGHGHDGVQVEINVSHQIPEIVIIKRDVALSVTRYDEAVGSKTEDGVKMISTPSGKSKTGHGGVFFF